jgi:hypothetical protein
VQVRRFVPLSLLNPLLLIASTSLFVAACNDSSRIVNEEPEPVIVGIAGPKNNAVACDPKTTGGACPLSISVSFRLPEDQFVWRAIVRFQGDGSDDGVDRQYQLEYTYGLGTSTDVTVNINAFVPPTILRRGALFTYTVRLLTGAGAESRPSTLTVSVQ